MAVQMQSVDQNQFSEDDGSALEVDGLPAVIAQVFHVKQASVSICGGLRQEPLKVGEEGRIVKGPFRSFLFVRLEVDGEARDAIGRGSLTS